MNTNEESVIKFVNTFEATTMTTEGHYGKGFHGQNSK